MKFSWIGLILVILVYLPNLIYIKYPPMNKPLELKDVHLVFTAFERIGQSGLFVLFVLSGIGMKEEQGLIILPLLMIIFLVSYYGLWIRYLIYDRNHKMLFQPLFKIPIPMAVFPICYFFLAAIWSKSIVIGIVVAIFSVGHLVNSWNQWRKYAL